MRRVDRSFISKQVRNGQYYFLDLEATLTSEIGVLCGGREVCGADYRIDRAGFRYPSLEYVASGQGTLQLDGHRFSLRPGSIFFYGPKVRHTITVEGGSTMVKYFVNFVGVRPLLILKDTPLGSHTAVQVAEPQSILEIYEQLQRTASLQRSHMRRICDLLLEMLILRACELAVPPEAVDSQSWASYQNCRSYIENHYLELKDLGQVASACGISKAYICRVFKRYHPCSPYHFLAQQKMSHAASLLLAPQSMVKQVARQVGFEDVYHFSKAFKRSYGISPAQFRSHRQQG